MNPDTAPGAETPYVRENGYAERYRDRRFRSGTGSRTHAREVAALRWLLARGASVPGRWIDVPSGAGRFSDELPGPVVQVDRELTMLRAAPGDHDRVCAAGAALPFADDAFAGCLCMRLIHHIPTSAERVRILSELRRVTAGPVVVSFFHSWSLQHLRRVIARRLGKTRSGRCAVSWRQLRRDLAAAGLTPVHNRALRRYVSEQWLVLARRTRASSHGHV